MIYLTLRRKWSRVRASSPPTCPPPHPLPSCVSQCARGEQVWGKTSCQSWTCHNNAAPVKSVYLCEYMCTQLSREEKLWGVHSPRACVGGFCTAAAFSRSYWSAVSLCGRKWDDNTCVPPLSQSCNGVSSAPGLCLNPDQCRVQVTDVTPHSSCEFPINPLLVAGVYYTAHLSDVILINNHAANCPFELADKRLSAWWHKKRGRRSRIN